jgi:hypothetical protein
MTGRLPYIASFMLQCARGQCRGCAGARFWGRGVRWWGCASSPQCHPRRLIGFRKRVRACARSRACEFASVRFAACRQILALPRRGCDAVGLQDASCPLRQHKRATRGEEQRSCDREPKERVPVREQTAARTCGRKNTGHSILHRCFYVIGAQSSGPCSVRFLLIRRAWGPEAVFTPTEGIACPAANPERVTTRTGSRR